MNVDQLRQEYGHDWVIRTWPQPGATRRRQLDNDPDRPNEFYAAMTIWADTLPELAHKLAEQTKLAAEEAG